MIKKIEKVKENEGFQGEIVNEHSFTLENLLKNYTFSKIAISSNLPKSI